MTLSTSQDRGGLAPAGAERKWDGAWLVAVRRYAVATISCAAFSAAYECLSHGVWSIWMVTLCAYPLLLGVLPMAVCGCAHVRVGWAARQLWACGVMTLVAGSCLAGVFEIYGTTSELVWPYLPMGLALLVLGGVARAGE